MIATVCRLCTLKSPLFSVPYIMPWFFRSSHSSARALSLRRTSKDTRSSEISKESFLAQQSFRQKSLEPEPLKFRLTLQPTTLSRNIRSSNMAPQLSPQVSPKTPAGPRSGPSSRFGEWVLAVALLVPAFFLLVPASFGVPDLLRALHWLWWLQVRVLVRADMEVLLILLILLGILCFLYIRQVRFLISEYRSWYPLPAPSPRFHRMLGGVEVRGPTLAQRRRRDAITQVTTPDFLKDLRSPPSSQRED